MDPQSVVFQPQNDLWRMQNELQRIQAVQAEHSDRILRLERKQDDDARMKSVWGGASPFPNVLSGTPQQTPLHQPPSDAFKEFDDESANLIGSLHLDPEEEPRRIGATSRANSVRFDESANQGWAHTSRSSMDLMRSGGGIPMSERTSSHKSDGRASSVHSLRSAASGRANSLNLDTGFSFGDSNRSPVDTPGLAPGLFLLGSVPAIIRCWMNNNFRHDALLYAAVCTGSHKSFLDRRLVDKLGFSSRINITTAGLQTIVLPIYFPEAVPHPTSTRSGSPAPQLPTLTVNFTILPAPLLDTSDDKGIQIIIGSDTLRVHNADILFSSNNLSLFDDDRNKISIPLVRPEDERTFNVLRTTAAEPTIQSRQVKVDDGSPQDTMINGLGQSKQSSAESMPSLAAGVPIGTQRTSTAPSGTVPTGVGAAESSDDDEAPTTGRSIRFAQLPSQSSPTTTETTPVVKDNETNRTTSTRTSSSPAIWSNWRQRGPETPQTSAMDYANASKAKEPAPRKESGIKVLRPMKSASRTFSATSTSTSNSDGKSRFFDDGKRRATMESLPGEQRREGTPPVENVDRSGQGQSGSGGGGPARVNPAGDAEQSTLPTTDPHFSLVTLTLEHLLPSDIISIVTDQRPPIDATPSSQIPRSCPNPGQLSHAATTASHPKKRKTTPSTTTGSGSTLFAPEVHHADRQPSPSLGSSSPAPSSPLRTSGTLPDPPPTGGHRSFLEGIDAAADSPSDAYAAMTLGSGSGEDMREDLPGRRSASPAKRSAAAMEGEEVEMVSGTTTENETAVIDERIKKVWELSNTSVEEGEEGYVISQAWLKRVQARSSEGKGKAEESDTEGSIGPVDNSGIVPEGAFTGPHLKFEKGDVDFVPLKPQLERSADYEVLPKAAWDLIVEWYGVADGQSPIVRFAKDTAPPESTATNIQYEIYPPVFTVRKMLSASDKTARPPSPPGTNNHSQANTVQTTPEREAQAVKLVASRQDRYQSFLARCKRAAGVPMEHKVRPWRQVNTAQVVVNPSTASRPGILTPAASRTNSPGPESTTQSTSSSLPSLLVERAEFDKFEEGTSIEIVDMKDETGNPNYNGGGKITLDVVGLIEDQTLILEEQVRGPAGGEFISDTKRAKKKTEEAKSSSAQDSDASTSGPVTRGRAKKSGKSRGTVGLQNLGNTCYMNSALQCISRIEELAWYFLSSKWKQEINGDNPLGYNGNMARAYADFLSGLHKEGAMATFTPRQFKNALAAAQPMFSGYGQQDSQEFLSFLVDALHEDLNRIHKKPYLENPDSDDSRVHDPAYITELGEKYRENHRARNNSIAMDLFSGFYKNRMDCPECKKVSVTFDPYSLLTLQLPIETTWQHKVIYIPHKGQPSQRMVDVDKSASIRNFKQRFAEKVGARPENLFVAEFFSQRLYKVWKDTEQVSEISQNDQIAVFEFDNAPTNITKTKSMQYRSFSSPRQDDIPDMDSPLADHMAVTVVNRTNNKSHWGPTYQPLIVMISRDEAKEYDLILKKILAQLAKYTSRNFLSEDAALPTQTSMSRKSSDSGLTSNTESPEPVDAKLSDRSVPSEDEYVNVSMRDGSSPATATDDLPEVLRPGAAIPAGLRSLFKVGYYSSPTGDMNCTGNSATIDAAPMLERVNYNTSRRSSVTSITSAQSNQSGSTEHSTTSATSQTLSATADDDSSEVLPLTNGRDTERWAGDPQSDAEDEMNFMQPSDMVENTFKAANRRKHDIKNKNRRGNRRIQRTYAKRDKARPAKKADPVRSFPPRSPSGPNAANDPYFIKLGEGIVLDWSEEGWDALFGGDIRSPDERGYGTIDDKVLTITEDPELDAKLEKRRRRKKEGVSLEDCFAETARTETLSEENAWYCNRCKELRRADKTLEIWTAPDILVLHLKRFSGERYRRDKVDVLVDFPLEGLDLSSRVGLQEDGKGYLYDLFAVDNHYGGLGGGHYTAYARNFWDGKWYDFNDSFVSQTNPASVVTPAAYLLFYRRRSDRPLGPRYLQDLVIEARNAADAEEETPDSFAGPGRTLSAAETKKEGSNASARLLLPGPARAEAVYDSAPKDGVPIGTCDGRAMQGPVRPPALGEGAGWNFDGLDGAADAREREGEGSDPDSMKIELPEEEEEGDGDGREWLLGQPTDDEEGEGEVRMSVE
ncbi:Ubiquitin carboxyl-terminal hydrolase-like protein 14 [Elsinoe fawcettii]|nr:Ubiquitin carboxyl-terminal hydrolase-like protein 14 [Elsinoe fawcettii]